MRRFINTKFGPIDMVNGNLKSTVIFKNYFVQADDEALGFVSPPLNSIIRFNHDMVNGTKV